MDGGKESKLITARFRRFYTNIMGKFEAFLTRLYPEDTSENESEDLTEPLVQQKKNKIQYRGEPNTAKKRRRTKGKGCRNCNQ